MSLVLRPVHSANYTFRDNDAKEATSSVMLPSATTAANALTYAGALAALLTPLSGATLVGYNVLISYVENAIGVIGSSDVEDKGVFRFATVNGIQSSIAIPGILESVLQGNNADIDLANEDVDAFVTAMTAGLSSIQPANVSGSDLVGVLASYKQNRQSHKSRGTRKG